MRETIYYEKGHYYRPLIKDSVALGSKIRTLNGFVVSRRERMLEFESGGYEREKD